MPRSAARFVSAPGWYGFNRDPAGTKDMMRTWTRRSRRPARTRGKEFQIIITPPATMPMDRMREYEELGVDRLVVNLGSQRPERVDPRMTEIEALVKMAA